VAATGLVVSTGPQFTLIQSDDDRKEYVAIPPPAELDAGDRVRFRVVPGDRPGRGRRPLAYDVELA
jgi:hypothetical protein